MQTGLARLHRGIRTQACDESLTCGNVFNSHRRTCLFSSRLSRRLSDLSLCLSRFGTWLDECLERRHLGLHGRIHFRRERTRCKTLGDQFGIGGTKTELCQPRLHDHHHADLVQSVRRDGWQLYRFSLHRFGARLGLTKGRLHRLLREILRIHFAREAFLQTARQRGNTGCIQLQRSHPTTLRGQITEHFNQLRFRHFKQCDGRSWKNRRGGRWHCSSLGDNDCRCFFCSHDRFLNSNHFDFRRHFDSFNDLCGGFSHDRSLDSNHFDFRTCSSLSRRSGIRTLLATSD